MNTEVDTEDLIAVSRPGVSDEQAAKQAPLPQRTVAQKLIHLTFDRRALLLVIAGLVVALVVQPKLFVDRLVEPEKVFVIDAEGNIVMGPVVRFEKSEKMQRLLATQATDGLLNRTRDGFSDEDFLTTLFADQPLAQARAEFKKEEDDYKKRNIEQSVYIYEWHYTAQGDDYYLRTKGVLHRVLTDNLQNLRQSPDFQVVFHCKKNPRITINNRFPLVVVEYQYEEPSK
jgi:hypothetical protein